MPDYFQLMAGTFFEIGAVYLLASGSVDHLRKLQGGTAQIDRRRFRPNIYIESEAECGGFIQDSWLGGALNIGGGAVRVEGFQPTVWCVTATLPQQDPARPECTSDHRAAPPGLPRRLRHSDQPWVAPSRRCGIPRESRD